MFNFNIPPIINPIYQIWREIKGKESRWLNFFIFKNVFFPRHKNKLVKFDHFNLEINDIRSFISMYRDIFIKETYLFKCNKKKPLILDCGANIGLSICFFKKKYPHAKIIAFEPDPSIFKILKRNIVQNHLSDVVLVNKALWNKEGEIFFACDGADGGRITKGRCGSKAISVRAVRLGGYLQKRIDFLKMDIEGAESVVIKDIID